MPYFSEEILDHEPENLTHQISSQYLQPVQNLKCNGKKNKFDFPDEFEITTRNAPYVIYSHTESSGLYREERYHYIIHIRLFKFFRSNFHDHYFTPLWKLLTPLISFGKYIKIALLYIRIVNN